MAGPQTDTEVEMFRARRRRFWLMFCERNNVGDGVPLFDERDGAVDIVHVGSSRRRCLARSPEMEALVMDGAAAMRTRNTAG